MKKALVVLVALLMLMCCSFISIGVNSPYNGIVQSRTVTDSAKLIYSKKFGTNYKNSPTTPLVVGDTLIVASGKRLYKLKAADGTVLNQVDMIESNMYALALPLYADGKIIVQLDNGTIQAFSFETFESLWIYKDKLAGQSLTPITYSYGYIYTGFWNGEEENANYVCISVKDENPEKTTERKLPRWTYKVKGGFYGAGCTVTEKFVIFGSDDGKRQSNGESKIISLFKDNGKLADTLSVKGDIRAGVVYSEEEDAYYTAAKSGYIYKFRMNKKTGKLAYVNSFATKGGVTATPIIYNGKIYVGSSNGSGGDFLVIDADTMKLIYSGKVAGYPQASALVSLGYKETTEKVYIYITLNVKPGGIVVFEDSENQKEAIQRELFMPDETMSEYCISTIATDEDGNLYYKNDSGNIFAIGRQKETISLLEWIIRFIVNVINNVIKK